MAWAAIWQNGAKQPLDGFAAMRGRLSFPLAGRDEVKHTCYVVITADRTPELAEAVTAATGAFVNTGGWYEKLAKPAWNPPSWVFGPVWTTLFILMGIAVWLVWKPEGFKHAAVPMTLFAVQLVLNVSWSWIFFGMHQPGWAFLEIVILWLAIVATTVTFFQCSMIAGRLMGIREIGRPAQWIGSYLMLAYYLSFALDWRGRLEAGAWARRTDSPSGDI